MTDENKNIENNQEGNHNNDEEKKSCWKNLFGINQTYKLDIVYIPILESMLYIIFFIYYPSQYFSINFSIEKLVVFISLLGWIIYRLSSSPIYKPIIFKNRIYISFIFSVIVTLFDSIYNIEYLINIEREPVYSILLKFFEILILSLCVTYFIDFWFSFIFLILKKIKRGK